jgi:hypothetical protein
MWAALAGFCQRKRIDGGVAVGDGLKAEHSEKQQKKKANHRRHEPHENYQLPQKSFSAAYYFSSVPISENQWLKIRARFLAGLGMTGKLSAFICPIRGENGSYWRSRM